MPVTSTQQTWLESSSAIRIVLVQVSVLKVGTGVIDLYFSNGGYSTSDATDKAIFVPILTGAFGFQESISPDGTASMSIGDIEIYNLNGEYDDYLNTSQYIWSNQPIKIYYGDPGWTSTKADIPNTFINIFSGVIDDVDSRSNTSINFKIRDKLELANSPVTENKIGTYGVWPSGQQNTDTIRPLVFGEVFNITPVSIDPSTYEYCFSSGNPTQETGFPTTGIASEKLIEIRDNGVPIYRADDTATYNGAIVNLANSTFKLKNTPYGTITCSVQGVKKSINLTTGALSDTYTNTIPNIIAVILTQFGRASARFQVSDLDLQTFRDFNSTAKVGILISDTQNVLEVCKALAASVGGQLTVGREGKIKLVQFGNTNSLSTVTAVNIGTSDILYDSLNISQRIGVTAAKKIAYARNYTIQSGLLTFIPDEHKDIMETEWLTVTNYDSTVATNYNLQIEPQQIETYLIDTASATAEALRLNTYYKTQKTVYSFTGTAKLLSLTLGQKVYLKHHRYGLSSGTIEGQVIALRPNWNKDLIEVEVII